MLEVSKATIAKYKPDLKVSFLSPQELKGFENYFDAVFNFNSFSEMDKGVLNRYFELIYNGAKEGAVFYDVNYYLKSKGLKNNPLFFPYNPKDEVICWEDNAFQYATKGSFNKPPHLSLARIARIRK